MKLLYLTALVTAIPACLAASSSSPKSSAQHRPTDPLAMPDMGAIIDNVLPTVIGLMDMEGQLAQKLCEHDNSDDPSKCIELIAAADNQYRLQVRAVMDKTGLQQPESTSRNKGTTRSNGKKSKSGYPPSDPVKQCVEACVALLEEQCNKNNQQHGHLECNKSAQRKQCKANCHAYSTVFSKKIQEDMDGLLKDFQ
ncbi:hypothetical protein BDV96DRAFT_565104 [Lophiotrema nucula]|uniref:Uncharacterized protein n=1 Tax=Lophiotrema nucula TaxID=690887 RepID=A0A6A5ZNU7_9PLEO|nr:hypothetical protein BDV96DRAFT_565104 [Lophiotrema nucula]